MSCPPRVAVMNVTRKRLGIVLIATGDFARITFPSSSILPAPNSRCGWRKLRSVTSAARRCIPTSGRFRAPHTTSMSIVARAVDATFVMNCIRSAKQSMSILFAKAYAATATRSPLVTVISALRSIAWGASKDWHAGSSLREQWRQVSYSTCTHNYFVEEDTGGEVLPALL